ncbi:Protein kinase domain-containing protein [Mycena indigotica]|uniref:Protein kinase domain-containing protein n=1 Tax=Mycena indigotica TaxID=2126181 RepID=A0A8H6W998_9AGAR|nr:Protein kinase domain-containing protein [Mycena indigotica]KAF7306393.1 Protein kinase domain-containing protein [Mycena indigotica]
MHSHNIAHRDPCLLNLMMDPSEVVPEGSHFANTHRNRMGEDHYEWRDRCLVHPPVAYYFIDFELSEYYPNGAQTAQSIGIYGQDRTAPELSDTTPYNPFKVDVYQLGNTFVELSERYPIIPTIFGSLLEAMTHPNPDERPTASEAVHRLEKICSDLSPEELGEKLVYVLDTEGYDSGESVSEYELFSASSSDESDDGINAAPDADTKSAQGSEDLLLPPWVQQAPAFDYGKVFPREDSWIDEPWEDSISEYTPDSESPPESITSAILSASESSDIESGIGKDDQSLHSVLKNDDSASDSGSDSDTSSRSQGPQVWPTDQAASLEEEREELPLKITMLEAHERHLVASYDIEEVVGLIMEFYEMLVDMGHWEATELMYAPHTDPPVNAEHALELGYDENAVELMQRLPYVREHDLNEGRRPYPQAHADDGIDLDPGLLPLMLPWRHGWLVLLDTRLGLVRAFLPDDAPEKYALDNVQLVRYGPQPDDPSFTRRLWRRVPGIPATQYFQALIGAYRSLVRLPILHPDRSDPTDTKYVKVKTWDTVLVE